MARVLSVGYIPEFLQERERILRTARHEVTTAPSFPAAITTIELGSFDVAVFCFSIPAEERKQLAQRLKQASPNTKLIMLYLENIRNAELADALLPTSASAEDVLRAVNYLAADSQRSQTS